ncbi:MAG: hypothetical protein CMH64_04745 [Nanoarchaeota archaeon]|nr:hypothetical protein [Nanoarchaeota archaeon]
MQQDRLDDVLLRAYNEVNGAIAFGEELWENSRGVIKPKMHQIVRIYEAVNQGTKRMVLEDTTSSGKTLNAVAIKGMMDKYSSEGKVRSLLIAPNQAISSAWAENAINRYTDELGLKGQDVMRIEEGSVSDLLEKDFVSVNYDKLSRGDSENYTNEHLKKLKKLLPHMDLVIVDESHNLKNIKANRTQAFTDVVRGTMDKNFLILSASAIPNRIKDAGYLLYMFDPIKYKHYARNPFDYQTDRFSVMNARNSPGWFTFGRDDLKNLLNLPELYFGDENIGIEAHHKFEMGDESINQYFEEWKPQADSGSKISKLSRILLESEFDEIINICEKIEDNDPRAQVGIFSFYTAGFSEEMARKLNEKFGNAAVITGNNPKGSSTTEKVEKRLEIAKRFNTGELKYLVNTTSTVSESISLITEDRPCYLIFAEPPIVPAVFDQAIGRFYRIGQKAPVHVIEMIPYSDRLNEMMRDYRESLINKVKFRTNWVPGTLSQNTPKIRDEKIRARKKMTTGRRFDYISESINAEEGSQNEAVYNSLLKIDENGDSNKNESKNKRFMDGINSVTYHIGRSASGLASSDAGEALRDVYDDDELWNHSSSADTNLILSKIIRAISSRTEARTGNPIGNILDWGSASMCLGRVLEGIMPDSWKGDVYNLDLMEEWNELGIEKAKKLGLERQILMHGNAMEMPFEDGFFDLVSSSYALQYNAQGFEHKRDVEQILKETNRVLSSNGFGLFALPNQAARTTIEDSIDGLETLLDHYGFNVLFSEYVTGHAENPRTNRPNMVFQGAPIILYQKEKDQESLINSGFEDVFIYSPYKLSGIGGQRKRKTSCPSPRNSFSKPRDLPSEEFKIKGNEKGQDGFSEAIDRALDKADE